MEGGDVLLRFCDGATNGELLRFSAVSKLLVWEGLLVLLHLGGISDGFPFSLIQDTKLLRI